jgi:predicted nucleotide-binding protein
MGKPAPLSTALDREARTNAMFSTYTQAGREKIATATFDAFKQRWELFCIASNHVVELVESILQHIGSKCLIDETMGSASAGSVPVSLTTASASR